MTIFWRFPVLCPLVMVAWNTFYFVACLINEGKVKLTVLKFIVAYAMTVRPAFRGDMEPFVTVFTMPA